MGNSEENQIETKKRLTVSEQLLADPEFVKAQQLAADIRFSAMSEETLSENYKAALLLVDQVLTLLSTLSPSKTGLSQHKTYENTVELAIVRRLRDLIANQEKKTSKK